MTKRRRVPEVLWKLFQNRARTLAETILSLINLPPSVMVHCRCYGRRHCLRCVSDGDRMSFLLREDDPYDYRNLLNHCFLVVSDNAPSSPSFDHHSRWPQLENVRRTIELILYENPSTKNVLCTGYSKNTCSSIFVEALTSASWSLLLQRVGDELMVHLLRYYSIFMPVNRKKHHQIAGIPIDDLCWGFLKHIHESKNQLPLLDRYQEVDYVSMNIDNPESAMSCHGCNVEDSITTCHEDSKIGVHHFQTMQENGLGAVAQSAKRLRSHACRRRRKRRKLSSQNICDLKSSVPEEKIKFLCSCCSVWKTLKKVPRKAQVSKRSMFYNLKHASSVLPKKRILFTSLYQLSKTL